MTEVAIRVKHLSKRFRIPLDRSTTLKYRMLHPRRTSRYRDFFALDDVSFDTPHGQFLGITGPNGCGKSTLLKILSRIYAPDNGRVEIDGFVSPFLELGVGFNPELTARENVFLGGAVLGLHRKELARRVDHILEFAELTEFADQKIKNFSSGMHVRLAFSVAIQADAGVLLMDEVLAVGDARFQEKCFDVFARYKREGRTVVLVSHDLGSLNLYCDRVLLLQSGRLIADGTASDVTSQYRRMVGAMSDGAATDSVAEESEAPVRRWGSREVEITGMRLLDATGAPHRNFATGEPMTVAIDYTVNSEIDEFIVGLAFKRSDGLSLSGPNTKTSHYRIPGPPRGSRGTLTYTIGSLNLLAASYLLTVAVYDAHLAHAYDHVEDMLPFRVVDDQARLGLVELGGRWEDTSVEERGVRLGAVSAGKGA